MLCDGTGEEGGVGGGEFSINMTVKMSARLRTGQVVSLHSECRDAYKTAGWYCKQLKIAVQTRGFIHECFMDLEKFNTPTT